MASVAKRKWKRPDGSTGEKWTVRYVDQAGRHRQSTFERKKEADAFRVQVESDITRGMLAPDARRIDLRQAIDAFLAHQEQRMKDRRIGYAHLLNTTILLRKHITPYLASAKLAEINLETLTKWHRQMLADTGLSPFTGKMIVRLLGGVFDYAMRREWVHRNPARLLQGDLRGLQPARVRTFGTDEIKAVLLAANVRPYRGYRPDAHLRLQCAVHLAAFCGLRLGEIFGLHVDDIDMQAGVISIRKSMNKWEGIKAPKSAAGVRRVAMPAHVTALLQAWIETYLFSNANGFMFRAKDGRAIAMDGFRASSWGALLERAGFARISPTRPAFRFHALRHFAASWMIDTGWSLPEVAKTLGHAKVDMTMSVYAHALQDRATSRPQMQALADRLLTQQPAH